jgi:hypothetical protein
MPEKKPVKVSRKVIEKQFDEAEKADNSARENVSKQKKLWADLLNQISDVELKLLKYEKRKHQTTKEYNRLADMLGGLDGIK